MQTHTRTPTPAQEDIVCSVCHTGYSELGNELILCDGCNMCVHQVCYGYGELTEGAFYCAACTHLRDQPRAKTARVPNATQIQATCCPVVHGGLKQAADGSWIHLACAMWQPKVGRRE